MEKVIIRKAVLEDEDAIIEFIKQHWYIKNHIFVREKRVFEDCHRVEDELNFVLGVGEETGNIYGICGWTLTNRTDHPEVCPAIYQTIKSSNTMLGTDLVKAMEEVTQCRCVFSPGIRPNTKVIYDFMGYRTGLLSHYYRIADLEEYKVAKISQKIIPQITEGGYSFQLFNSMDEVLDKFRFEDFKDKLPYKDEWCVRHRYFENIGYQYKVYGIIKQDGSCTSIFAGRDVGCNGRTIFKIVDYIGEDRDISFCSLPFQKLIEENNYEFIDIYEQGIPDEYMESAGLVKVLENDENIIPHYFEPYVLENIDIYYYSSNMDGCHIYRSDAGQDRPNYI